jgi:hypothetical protein
LIEILLVISSWHPIWKNKPGKRMLGEGAIPDRAQQITTMNATSIIMVLAAHPLLGVAATTINDTNKYGFGANIGWINWRDANSGSGGAVVGEFVCSGWLWSANVGWINLGDSTPANNIQYSNTDGTDFGVNHDGTGLLRGLAYGGNIGWISFEATGNPRFDPATGMMSGYAWSANCGWFNLGDGSFYLKTDIVAPGVDSDSDGIADAWEFQRTGSLTLLNATGNRDDDGASDVAEYAADTDPISARDYLRITSFSRATNGSQFMVTWTSESTRRYRLEECDALTGWTTTLSDIMPDMGATTTRSASLAPLDSRHFFRIQVFRPLSP